MSLTVLKEFPKEVLLSGNNLQVSIRPLAPGDAVELLAFFSRIPEEDRFFLKEDVTSPEVISTWAEEIDYNRVVPLVGLLDGEIVADATLHRHRAGARRHIGEIRVVVDPRYRHMGLGTLMIREVVDIAYDNAMDGLIFELVEGNEDNAIALAKSLGFQELTSLPSFVKDLEGRPHDLVLLQLPLDNWLESRLCKGAIKKG